MQNTNSKVPGAEFGSTLTGLAPNIQSLHTRTQTAADIKEAFAFKHAVNCDYISFENRWTDSLGNQRTGKEPDRRRNIRYHLQGTRDPIEHKHALDELKEFDRSWKK